VPEPNTDTTIATLAATIKAQTEQREQQAKDRAALAAAGRILACRAEVEAAEAAVAPTFPPIAEAEREFKKYADRVTATDGQRAEIVQRTPTGLKLAKKFNTPEDLDRHLVQLATETETAIRFRDFYNQKVIEVHAAHNNAQLRVTRARKALADAEAILK